MSHHIDGSAQELVSSKKRFRSLATFPCGRLFATIQYRVSKVMRSNKQCVLTVWTVDGAKVCRTVETLDDPGEVELREILSFEVSPDSGKILLTMAFGVSAVWAFDAKRASLTKVADLIDGEAAFANDSSTVYLVSYTPVAHITSFHIERQAWSDPTFGRMNDSSRASIACSAAGILLWGCLWRPDIASFEQRSRVVLYDLKRQGFVLELDIDHRFQSLAIAPSGNLFAVSGRVTYVYDLEAARRSALQRFVKVFAPLKPMQELPKTGTVSFSSDSTQLAIGGSIFDARSGRNLHNASHPLYFSPTRNGYLALDGGRVLSYCVRARP